MKTYNLFTILFLAFILLSSCNNDENGISRQVTLAHTYSENIRGSEGVKGELHLPNLRLADAVGDEIAASIQKANLQLAETYFEISGLNQLATDTTDIILEDFTIKVGSRAGINMGNFTTNPQSANDLPSDVQLSTNDILNIVQNVFADMTSGNKRAEITLSFTPNVDISSADNVQLVIHFEGIYNYLEVE